MRSSMLEEMFASNVEDGDFLSITDVNDEQGIPKPISKKIKVGELMKYIQNHYEHTTKSLFGKSH